MLRAGKVDFVLARMADPPQMMGLAFEFLYVEPLVLAVRPGHPLADHPSAGLSDVLGYPLVVFSEGTIPRHNTESYLQSQGLRLPHNCTETLSVSVGRLLTQRSDSIWIIPAGAVRADFEQGTLAQVPLAMRGTEEPVGLLNRSEGRLSAAAREFVAVLREAAAARAPAAEPGKSAAAAAKPGRTAAVSTKPARTAGTRPRRAGG
jgi:DNA-binding transcriptional LysR family regulator